MIHLGCASWRLPKPLQAQFPGEGTHLARYAARLPAVELNSSFYRHHRRSQYAKWAGEVPADFRMAVKMPRTITHHQRLRGTDGLDQFLAETEGLGDRLGPLLIQLPPSLAYVPDHVSSFLTALRERFTGTVVCEPRHGSWFTSEVDALLRQYHVSRVAANPPPVAGAERPGGDEGCVYLRLHGSPRRFYSAYSEGFLQRLAEDLEAFHSRAETWCIFNNTATSAGLENALSLQEWLRSSTGAVDEES